MRKPYKLRCWKPAPPLENDRFFTCARPGRSKGKHEAISDDLVDRWIEELPGGSNVTIVSLLGRKNGPTGTSEFSFYSFSGGFDTRSERDKKPSFQQWFSCRHHDRRVSFIEHPTFDGPQVSNETLDAVKSTMVRLLNDKATIFLVDSGGETRVKQVCAFMGATEDCSRPLVGPTEAMHANR